MVKSVIGQIPTGEDCFGREAEIKSAWDKVERGESLLLLAPRRSGKSAIMRAMQDNPRAGWAVRMTDVESLSSALGVVSRMFELLIEIPEYRGRLENSVFGRRFLGFLEDARAGTPTEKDTPAQLMLNAIGREWSAALDDLRERIPDKPGAPKVLLILDELPIVAAKLVRQGDDGKRELEGLLDALRELCLHDKIRGRFALVIGGSIGLSHILDRAGIRSVDNHLADMFVRPWSRETADEFIIAWTKGEACPVNATARGTILDCLGTAYIPSHVQQTLDELRDHLNLATASAADVRNAFDKHVVNRTARALLKNYGSRLKEMLSETEHKAAEIILRETSAHEVGVNVQDIVAYGVDDETFGFVIEALEQDGYFRIDEDGHLTFPARLIRLYFARQSRRVRRRT